MEKDKENSRKKQEKRIHYNVISEPPSEKFLWYFLMIESENEMKKIKQRICGELNSVGDACILKEGTVGNSHGLKYSLFNLQSPRGKIDFSQVYSGKIIRDERLRSGESSINLLNVLEQEEILEEISRRNKTLEKDLRISYEPTPDYTW